MEDKIKNGFINQKFMETIGAQIGKIEPGACEIILPFDKKLTQQHGFLHGGVIATIADNAAGFAAYSLMEDGNQPLTIEFKINLLSPASSGNLISRAKVLRGGHKIFHTSAEVYKIIHDREILVATSLATIKSSRSISKTKN